MIEQSIQQFVFWLVTGGVAVAYGWLLRLESGQRSQERDLAALRLHMADSYPSNHDFQKLESQLLSVGEKVDTALQMLSHLTGRQEAERAR